MQQASHVAACCRDEDYTRTYREVELSCLRVPVKANTVAHTCRQYKQYSQQASSKEQRIKATKAANQAEQTAHASSI